MNNRHLLGLINKICDLIYNSVDKIVVLSPGFKELLIARSVPERKIDIIYNWTDEEAIRSAFSFAPDEMTVVPGFKVLFAGNVGKAQELNVVIDAASLLQDDYLEISFVFLGRGLELDTLKRRAADFGLKNIQIGKHIN